MSGKWDAMLADIAIKPFGNLPQALDRAQSAVGPRIAAAGLADRGRYPDPIEPSRRRPTRRSRRRRRKAGRIGQRAAGFAAIEARAGLSLQQNELANILGEAFGSDASGKPVDPATRVDAHFKSLHDFVTAAGRADHRRWKYR